MVWEKKLNGVSHAGLAVNPRHCLIADRDPLDQFDVFTSLNPETGKLRWKIIHPAVGDLDYGNSSRSTPVLGHKYAWFQGAFGDCHCVELETGLVRWQQNVISAYGPQRKLIWGLCSSPILLGNQLILNPGGAASSLIALKAESGNLSWQSAGNDFGYGSLLVAKLGGRLQVVGHDKTTLGGWDAQTGTRIWSLVPKEKDDFNVPTPIIFEGKLIVATENNGTRMYAFDQQGKILPEPISYQPDLIPETISPVVAGNRLLGISRGTLYCLELPSLKIIWEASELAFDAHASLITDNKRLLIAADGELFLVDAQADHYHLVSHQELFEPGTPLYSHPAIMKNRLYIRGGGRLKCFALQMK